MQEYDWDECRMGIETLKNEIFTYLCNTVEEIL